LSGAGKREPPQPGLAHADDALELPAALEDARDSVIDGGYLTAVVAIEAQCELNHRLDVPTKELLRLIHYRKIRSSSSTASRTCPRTRSISTETAA
jgi:hypothetical protein